MSLVKYIGFHGHKNIKILWQRGSTEYKPPIVYRLSMWDLEVNSRGKLTTGAGSHRNFSEYPKNVRVFRVDVLYV